MSAPKPLQPNKIAFLVANGFSETELISVQRQMQQLGADTRFVSTEQGLVTSWAGNGWGLNFAADHALNASLAADYDALVIPGGQRSIDKLQLTAHTRRFIRGFCDARKPVCALNEASALLDYAEIETPSIAEGDNHVIDNAIVLIKESEPLDGDILNKIGEVFVTRIAENDEAASQVAA